MLLFLFVSPAFLVVLVLFFHSSKHANQKKSKPKNKETTKTSNKNIK
jgi:hypothetical protein